jgi:hypothetical protein
MRGRQYGVLDGTSQESDLDWEVLSAVAKHARRESTHDPYEAALGDIIKEAAHPDSPEEQPDPNRAIPQLDGVDDTSDDEVVPGDGTKESQRILPSESQGSSQRYGTIPLLRASPSTASAPAGLHQPSTSDSRGATPSLS